MAISLREAQRLIDSTVLATLTKSQIDELATVSELKTFAASRGDIWKRTSADSVLLVAEGRLRIVRRSPARSRRAKIVLLKLCLPGEVVGLSRICGCERSGECIADDGTRALVMPGELLARFRQENQIFAEAIICELRAIVGELVNEIVRLRTESFIERLIARIEIELGGTSGTLELTQRDLAELVGGSPSEVAKAMKAFAGIAFESEHGTLVVKDLAEARALLAMRNVSD